MKNSTFILILVLLVGALGGAAFWVFQPVYVEVKCESCEGTGKASCGAPGCVRGTAPCDHGCLQLGKGNWERLSVMNHPDTDIWMRYSNSDGSWTAFNQDHVGHMIELVGGKYTDTGLCPVCQGKGRTECPTCHGKAPCAVCHGKGSIQKELP